MTGLHIGGSILPAGIDIDITSTVNDILLHSSRPPHGAEKSPSVFAQYLSQRAELAREAVPTLLNRSRQAQVDQASISSALKVPEVFDERARLYIKVDCRRAYFPGQTVEAILAVDQEWLEAGPPALDGFSEVTVTFEGRVSSYGVENVTTNTVKHEDNPLFEESYSLKPYVGSSSLIRTSTVNGESITGLSLTPVENVDAFHPSRSSRLKAWHLRAVFPEAVHASRMVGNKNLFTKRKETRAILLPPSFRDDCIGGSSSRNGQNSVVYRISLKGKRIKKGKAPSFLAVPLLFLPLAIAPPPALTLVDLPAYSYDARSEAENEKRFVTLTCREKIRKGIVLDKAIVTAKVIMPRPVHVPSAWAFPFSILCSISSKDPKDLDDGGSISLPTLPLSGARDSFPALSFKRVETSKADWAEEIATTVYDCDTKWDDGHLRDRVTEQVQDIEAHGWSKPGMDQDTGRWTRRARLVGTVKNSMPPPVHTSSLIVEYQLHFSWKLSSAVKMNGFVTNWLSSSGIGPETLHASEGATRIALGSDYASLRAVADPILGPPAQPTAHLADDLPAYDFGSQPNTSARPFPNDPKPSSCC
ncbi:hypothetical protein K437DRAFT_273308 [Tilletiaria anomala UBC 951]|uniref:Uncharacterized protein n=1 Tax=Tilletiaria anomala (strain ATCC 24038 / CBS 436.72 / UBC 951) TaxID=1037660 RepID=A0A066W668_TILAU|nr:uncharacterized protein K437DRAFT_273308 [Tilletiaria anomala UBC 951]KDN49236.1 hypothetical protein K437DRAFT_273308 [Tilletiaria anomala UBC 951]